MAYYNSKNIIKSVRITDNTQQKIKRASQQAGMKESDFMGRAIENECDRVLMNRQTDIYKIIALETLKETAFIKAYFLHMLENDPHRADFIKRYREYVDFVLEDVQSDQRPF